MELCYNYRGLTALPEGHVERALPPMADGGGLKPDHEGVKLRQSQPERHMRLSTAALRKRVPAARALAGDDKDDPGAPGCGRAGNAAGIMGFSLRETVQIEPAIDRVLARAMRC